MIFYFERSTGLRVSKSTWKRSHAYGSTRFVRRSSERIAPSSEKKGGVVGQRVPEPEAKSAPPKAAKIKTAADYKKYYDQYNDYVEGPEIETGVDY